MARCGNRLDAGQEFLAVAHEYNAFAVRDEMSASALDHGLDGVDRQLAFVGPEFEIGLGHMDLRIWKIARAVVGLESPAMIRMGMGEHDRVDILWIDAGH